MGKIKKVFVSLFGVYIEVVKLLYGGIKGLGKLLYRYPLHTAFVIVITGIMTTIGAGILGDEQFGSLPFYIRVGAVCAIGVCSIISSVWWSKRIFSYRR